MVDFGLGTSFFFARERLFDGFFISFFIKKEEGKSNEYMDNKQQTTKQPLKNNQQQITNNQLKTTGTHPSNDTNPPNLSAFGCGAATGAGA